MNNTTSYIALCLSLFLLLTSCKKGDSSGVVAKYQDNVLTINELSYHIPAGMSSRDSARYAQQYIQQWLRGMAIADKAIKDKPDLEELIDYKVQDYKNKLLVNEYRMGLIKQMTSEDTVITADEIATYYENAKNKDKFLSKTDRYCYFIVVTDKNQYTFVRSRLASSELEKIKELEIWAEENAIEYKLDSTFVGDQQINQLQAGFYINLKNMREGQLRNWMGVTTQEERYYYFKAVKYVREGEVLPLYSVEDRIRAILLNQRKSRMIEREEEAILQQARSKGDIKNYYE